MKRKRIVFSLIFCGALLCLGFSVGVFDARAENRAFAMSSQIVLNGASTFTMEGGTISNSTGDNGGAVYVDNGATFTMSGGTISDCTATKGGAVYVASGGTFIYTGGMIENCSADLGYAVYVASGGVFNFEVNPEGFSGCGEEEGLHIYAEDGATIISPGTEINIFVDGTLSTTIKKEGDYYTIDESEMPLEYENCCGYFYDEKLSQCTNGVVDLTNGEINIYTKTASASSNFTFTKNSTTNTYDIKASSTSISGHIVFPKEYNNLQTSLESNAFDGCSELTSITFQDGLLEISNYSFYFLDVLEGELIIPDSVTRIGDYAFSECYGITGDLTIPNSVTSIGASAFAYCEGLTGDLTIPNSVTSIGASAFAYCEGLTGDLTIPNGVTSIGSSAFRGCSGFTGSLTIGNGVTSIGLGSFSGCVDFTNIIVNENNSVYEDKGKNAIVEKNTKTIVQGFNCTDLTVLDGLTSIGDYAFSGCYGFTGDLTIPNSVTSIGIAAFNGCSGFTGSLTIGNGVTSIGGSVFYNCSGLTGSLIIPDSVTSIGGSAFYNCRGLTGSLIIPDTVTSIGGYAFYICSGLSGLTIGNSVTSIGNYAFYSCSGFTGSLVIPNSVTSIGTSAFGGCTQLLSVYLPSSVTTISAANSSNGSFYGCSSTFSIYTDVADSSSKPSGWGTYWNYRNSSAQFTVNYGVSLEEYKAAVGLTFAPATNNDDNDSGLQIYNITPMAYQVNVDDYNQEAILNEEKEYVALLKENEKIA